MGELQMVAKPDRRDGWYDLNPAAAAALRENGVKNRPIRSFHANWLAQEMLAKRWVPNGETMILDARGKLLDGQHRCRAGEISGCTFRTYLVHLPSHGASFFDSIDQCAARSAGDRLGLDGVKNYNITAAMIRALGLYEMPGDKDATSSVRKFGTAEIRKKYESDRQGFDDAASAVASVASLLSGLVPAAVAAFVVYMASKQNAEKAALFLNGLATGENLSKTNPVLLLRNRLLEQKSSKKFARRYLLALTIRAWNCYRDQTAIKILKWYPTSPFPRFTDPGALTKGAGSARAAKE